MNLKYVDTHFEELSLDWRILKFMNLRSFLNIIAQKSGPQSGQLFLARGTAYWEP
jgi:hypothetical protein